MSVCSPCQKTKQVPKCVESLLIGNIGIAETDVTVYFKNISTGRLMTFPAESTIDGDVSIVDTCGFMPDQSYEMWITQAGYNIDDRLPITVVNDFYPVIGSVYECFAVRFVDPINCDDEIQEFTTYTIEIAE